MHPAAPHPDARPVLVGFDGSLAARAALRFAAQHAASVRAPLRVLACAENLTDDDTGGFAEDCAPGVPSHLPLTLDAAEQALGDADRFLRTCGPGDARTAMRFGPAVDALAQAAEGCRLLVLGRPDPWGPLGRTLSGTCEVPVALVPPSVPADRGTRRGDVEVHDVLVALAGDAGDDDVLAVGREWAVRRRSRLHVLHALRPRTTTGPVGSSWVRQLGSGADTVADTVATRAPVYCTMTHRPLADVVVDAAARACLVVVGRHGSQTDDLLTRIDRPVLVLPR